MLQDLIYELPETLPNNSVNAFHSPINIYIADPVQGEELYK